MTLSCAYCDRTDSPFGFVTVRGRAYLLMSDRNIEPGDYPRVECAMRVGLSVPPAVRYALRGEL